MAPEVIKGEYNEKCDVWSCGVILYIMLSGRPPFYSKNDNELKQKICEMKFSVEPLRKVSEDAKQFLQSIFVDQEKRPSICDLLEMKWIKEFAPHSTEDYLNIDWDHMKKYSKLNLVQKCVVNFTAFRLTGRETESFIKMFKSLDVNCDGVLTIEEIQQGAEKCEFLGEKMTVDELTELFNEMDVDKNGLINYTEFISALMDYEKYVKKERLIDCFKNYDLDGNGTISESEFMDMIKPQNEEEREKLKALYEQFDINKDGEIDFDEFVAGVMNSDDLL